jgi:hypothetical protein
MDKLKSDIERILKKHIPALSGECLSYILNFLYQYDYDGDKHQFKNGLSMNILLPLYRGLQSLLASIDAFQAAWDGKLSIVQKFIEKYPTLKDRPGLWGTTLLYSAARNNHMSLVEYLINTAKCSVNAQNEQHLEKILSSSKKTTTAEYEAMSKAASTALHGACYNGHLKIVQYLVENGANYFIKNQALETPLMNIESHDHIRKYFRDYLLLGYLKTTTGLPDKPISEEIRPLVDCLWEYRSFKDADWHRFSTDASKTLQQSLIVAPDEQFKHEINLTISDEIYTVSIIQFLRSGQKSDEDKNLAWIRCRGSSILNFDCYSLWQIMFLKHPNAETDCSPSLKIFDIPTGDDLPFKIQLHSWYNCDANTNSRFDHAMNYRQRLINLNLDFIKDKNLSFNLQTFSFSNNENTIIGFIRWIPKLISNNEQDKNKIKNIDNFAPMTNLNPIPLTTKRLEHVTEESDNSSSGGDELLEDGNDDDESSLAFSSNLHEDGDDDDQLQNSNEVRS